VSASEWSASANIAVDPEKEAAANFVRVSAASVSKATAMTWRDLEVSVLRISDAVFRFGILAKGR
jgi:hypothetical protein